MRVFVLAALLALIAASTPRPAVAQDEKVKMAMKLLEEAEVGSEVLQPAFAAHVIEKVDGTIGFSHPLLASVLYQGLGDDARGRVHSRVASLVAMSLRVSRVPHAMSHVRTLADIRCHSTIGHVRTRLEGRGGAAHRCAHPPRAPRAARRDSGGRCQAGTAGRVGSARSRFAPPPPRPDVRVAITTNVATYGARQ